MHYISYPVCRPFILASRAGAVKKILNFQHSLPLLLILCVVEIPVVIVHLLVRKNSLCGVNYPACPMVGAGGVRRARVVGKTKKTKWVSKFSFLWFSPDSGVHSTTQLHRFTFHHAASFSDKLIYLIGIAGARLEHRGEHCANISDKSFSPEYASPQCLQ